MPCPASRLVIAVVLAVPAILAAGCGTGAASRGVTIAQIEHLRAQEDLLPVGADSVVALHARFRPPVFASSFQPLLESSEALIDSLNRFLPDSLRVDTLAIDYTLDNLGEAATQGRTIYLSSSYFYLYPEGAVLRSVISHEFGHRFLRQLRAGERAELDSLWHALRQHALLYLFHDGEYAGNARFGGHPDDSPGELFASAFNLFLNRPDDLRVKLSYVAPQDHAAIHRLGALVTASRRLAN